jgi:hypothetical protein
VVRDFVQKCVKKLFNGPATVDAVMGVDPDKSARAIVASEHAPGGSRADIYRKLDSAVVDSFEPMDEKWAQSRNGRLKECRR